MDGWIGESLALAYGGGVMELVDDKWMKNMTPFSLFLALGVSQLLLL